VTPDDSAAVPVSVLVPTIGRPERLAACLSSIAACEPRPEEVLVVDQSGDPRLAALVRRFEARLVPCTGRGPGRARNAGLAEVRHETVLATDDDCTVAPDWVAVAKELAARHPAHLITGRVLPFGDPRAIPSTIDDPDPREYTGGVHCGALFANNMICPRSLARELGGFDDRLLHGEDNDFSYRWLRAGLGFRYEPHLVVWHHDWRTHEELERLYVRYYRGQGLFYAKHLRRRDARMLRFLARDLYGGLTSLAAAILRGRPRWTDPGRGIPRGLVPGLVRGWFVFGAPSERSPKRR
jgi:GT2 family glycosyltransferase